ncbi:MAG: DUF2510 domain-containing protein [Dermatophilaceae bacterium]
MSQGPAGWYPQPDGTERYWNGAGWTPAVRPPTYAVTPGTPITTPYPAAYVQDAGVSPAPVVLTPQPMPYAVPISRRSPGGALLASFLVPGLGQLINGEVTKAILFFVLAGIFGLLTIVVIGAPFLLITWVWGMIDAHSSATNWNRQFGIP